MRHDVSLKTQTFRGGCTLSQNQVNNGLLSGGAHFLNSQPVSMSPMTKRFLEQYPGMESRVKLRNYSSPESKEIWDVDWESSREEILLRWSLLVRGLMKVTHPTVQEVAQEAAEEVAQSKKRTIWTAESSKPESMLSTMNKKKLRLEGWRDCKRDDHF